MKKMFLGLAVILGAAIISPAKSKAENKFTVNGKADFVSDYIWRGADQNSGFSVQPSLTLGYAGLSLNVWGSQSLTKWASDLDANALVHGAKEFDINLSYSIQGFTIMVSDLWWSGMNRAYGDYANSHWFEGTVSYDFSACSNGKVPLFISWSTVFAGGADKNSRGKQNFSTYVSASYPIALPADITLTPSVGFLPWGAVYHGLDKTAWTDISLKASKDIKVTENFAIPLFVQALVSPVFDRTYLIAGFSLGF